MSSRAEETLHSDLHFCETQHLISTYRLGHQRHTSLLVLSECFEPLLYRRGRFGPMRQVLGKCCFHLCCHELLMFLKHVLKEFIGFLQNPCAIVTLAC